MSHVYVTSDWHIGHTGIEHKFRTDRGFRSTDDHDEYVLGRAREALTKRDILYVIGDSFWSHKALQRVLEAQIPATMYLVRGNHDTLPTKEYLKVFDQVYGAFRYKQFWFTHIPIHPSELRGKLNLHGHAHAGGPYENEGDTRYFNAILEYNDYRPVNMQVVTRLIKERYEHKNSLRNTKAPV